MDLAKVKQTLNEIRENDFGPMLEFEALQDIVASLTLRDRAYEPCLDREFYKWYSERLLQLYDEIVQQKKIDGPGYHRQWPDPRDAVIFRIRAILDAHPNTARVPAGT